MQDRVAVQVILYEVRMAVAVGSWCSLCGDAISGVWLLCC